MSGYGVEMVLKKTDYLVVDDRATSGGNSALQKLERSAGNGSGMFSELLGDDPWSETATPMLKSELKVE